MSYKQLYIHGQEPINVPDDATMRSILSYDDNAGKVYRFTGTTGTYINGDLYQAELNLLETPLCFIAEEPNVQVLLVRASNASWTGSYARQDGVWQGYSYNAITLPNIGDRVYFKGDITNHFSYDYGTHLVFNLNGNARVIGNINSMYRSENFASLITLAYEDCFAGLFENCGQYLLSAPILPATTLSSGCYYGMFKGCRSLITPPELPATTLGYGCYANMFENCYSLTTAPALPATTLTEACYYGMFTKCVSLTTVPKLAATTLTEYCYGTYMTWGGYTYDYGMFTGCTSLQVSSFQTEAAPYIWRIPESGTFYNTQPQTGMFRNCAGTRGSDDMAGASGYSYTYYTQNPPV